MFPACGRELYPSFAGQLAVSLYLQRYETARSLPPITGPRRSESYGTAVGLCLHGAGESDGSHGKIGSALRAD